MIKREIKLHSIDKDKDITKGYQCPDKKYHIEISTHKDIATEISTPEIH